MITNEFQRLNPGHWSLIFTWWTIPEPGGMISMLWNAVDPHLRQANHSLFLSNSSSMLACTALSDLTTSAVTEWSITRSAGTWTHKCRTKYDYTKKNPRKIGFLPKKKRDKTRHTIGLILSGSSPNWDIASRMLAKSTRTGTPVKS